MTDLYKQSGVDVEKGDRLVEWLQSSPDGSAETASSSAIGGFAGLFPLTDLLNYKNPALVSCTDGVGTKILFALEMAKKHGAEALAGLGQDLVAMVLNDMVLLGAKPLFFLDYYATGVLDQDQFKQVLSGMRRALSAANCSLVGGETAELPGLYEKGHFDLAGFGVGIVDQDRALGPRLVQAGDCLLAVPSSGFHSNGYSLLRKWRSGWSEAHKDKWDRSLLEPTKVYANLHTILQKDTGVHAISHITGGGLWGNLKRVLPDSVSALVDPAKIKTPEWMTDVISHAGASFEQAEKVFNMGIGLVIVADPGSKDDLQTKLKGAGHESYVLGDLVESTDGQTVIWGS